VTTCDVVVWGVLAAAIAVGLYVVAALVFGR
jgi:hypothetical protein